MTECARLFVMAVGCMSIASGLVHGISVDRMHAEGATEHAGISVRNSQMAVGSGFESMRTLPRFQRMLLHAGSHQEHWFKKYGAAIVPAGLIVAICLLGCMCRICCRPNIYVPNQAKGSVVIVQQRKSQAAALPQQVQIYCCSNGMKDVFVVDTGRK